MTAPRLPPEPDVAPLATSDERTSVCRSERADRRGIDLPSRDEGQRAESLSSHEQRDVSEAELRRIIDAIPTQTWCTRPDGNIVYLNKRWHDYTGITPAEVFGARGPGATPATDLVHLLHPDDAPTAVAKWSQIISQGMPGEYETRLRRHDGEYRWFIVRAEPMRDARGQVVQWYGTNTDIEDLRRAEIRLREEKHELRAIVDAIPQCILVLGTDGGVLYVNRSFLDYTGLTLRDAQGLEARAPIFHPEDVARPRERRQGALSGDAPFETEQRVRRADGQHRWFLFRYNPVRDAEGRVLRWYATAIDIHDRKLAEERVRNENQALREEIERRSMFEEVVGCSRGLGRVLAQVSKVAGTDSTALVLGETGTGKELIARALHIRSRRAAEAFYPSQLCGDRSVARHLRALRAREGRIHGRGAAARGPVRGSEQASVRNTRGGHLRALIPASMEPRPTREWKVSVVRSLQRPPSGPSSEHRRNCAATGASLVQTVSIPG
jgi:PAS domain S-box-containing protein